MALSTNPVAPVRGKKLEARQRYAQRQICSNIHPQHRTHRMQKGHQNKENCSSQTDTSRRSGCLLESSCPQTIALSPKRIEECRPQRRLPENSGEGASAFPLWLRI